MDNLTNKNITHNVNIVEVLAMNTVFYLRAPPMFFEKKNSRSTRNGRARVMSRVEPYEVHQSYNCSISRGTEKYLRLNMKNL